MGQKDVDRMANSVDFDQTALSEAVSVEQIRKVFGPPAEKRDLTTKYKNLKVIHILKILSM